MMVKTEKLKYVNPLNYKIKLNMNCCKAIFKLQRLKQAMTKACE